VELRGFRGMVARVLVVAVGDVGVLGALLGITRLVMLGGLSVMARRLFMMLGCLLVTLDRAFGHDDLLKAR